MTSYEHVMLGVTAGLAAGLHRRFGWQLVAVAGVAAVLPDWDGLAYFFGPIAFDRAHRAWGHSLWAAALLGAVFATLEYRLGWLDWAGRRFLKRFPTRPTKTAPPLAPLPAGRGGLLVWMAVGAIAALSHLAADLVFSGSATLPSWGLRLLWPWSDYAWTYPMIPWGEPVVTILFVAGMFAMVRWPNRIQSIAILTLASVTAYTVLRVPLFGAF